jgi:three-Cys-motif partner protein
MSSKNLHDKPFDEGTIIKLEIFESYAKEWLPTFIMSCPNSDLWIFDYFAGPGRDVNGVAGSPIRLLQQIKEQSGNIRQKQCKIHLCLNEYDKGKFKLLQDSCNLFIEENEQLKGIKDNLLFVLFRNDDFADLFPKTIPTISRNPSLLFLDQNGMRFMADEYLITLEKLKTTDFLYYLSSSYFVRFGETNQFQTKMKIDMKKARQNPYKYIHKSILEQLVDHLPKGSDLRLYPFSIKKGANIYGIIFGAKHPRAVDKFLKTAWSKNNINGEANFDIDEDLNKIQLDLFSGKKPTKIEGFQNRLRELILCGCITNNRDAYDYTLSQGHIDKHAAEEITKMKKEGLIDFEGRSPLVNYDQVYKNKRIVVFKLQKQ